MSIQPNMKRKPQSDASQNGQEGCNIQLQHQSIKRQRDDDEDDDNKVVAKEPTPTYGTKEYWEARYKSHHLQAEEVTVNENSYVLDGVLLSKDALRAGHEWYFTYDELRPILLPLILGKLDNEVDGSDYNIDDDEESWIEEEDEDEREEYEDDQEDENHTCEEDNIDDNKQSTCCEKESEHENGQKDNDDDAHDDIQKYYQGDTSIKPKRVLEIGCGDKPLGTALVSDLVSMQLPMVVGEVTCIDYSEVVVKSLVEQQKKEKRDDDHNCSTSAKDEDAQHESSDTNQLKPTFQALDARSLPFESNTWDIILDKGTLDAMLSDDDEGVHNCIKIVKEMARLTSEGGAILIVSHLNANEQKGMGWLEDVVFSGLKNEFMERRKMKSNNDGKPEEDKKKEYVWSVEVHGGEGKFLDVNGDEIENPEDDAIPTYGPAVYVIRKKSVPASVALDLFGKKKEEEEKDNSGEEGMKEDISYEEKELMEMPPVKLEFMSY